jgi:hypothetical protein
MRAASGQNETKMGDAVGGVELQRSTMGARDCPRDEQAKPDAVTTLVRAAGTKRLEQMGHYLVRNRSLIPHFDDYSLGVANQEYGDRRARRAVLNGVRRKVRNGLQDALLVPHPNALRTAIERDRAIGRHGAELVDDLLAWGA